MPELPRSHAPPNSCSRRAEEEELELNQTQNLFLGRLLVHLRNHVLELARLLHVIPLNGFNRRVLRTLLQQLILGVGKVDLVETLVEDSVRRPRRQPCLPDAKSLV